MFSLMAKGDYAKLVEQIATTPGVPPDLRNALVNAFRSGGVKGFEKTKIAFLLRAPDAKFTYPIDLAESYAAIGETDKAFEWLEVAYTNRMSRVTTINHDPLLDPLRSDPRFDDLLRRIGIPKLDSSLRPAVVG